MCKSFEPAIKIFEVSAETRSGLLGEIQIIILISETDHHTLSLSQLCADCAPPTCGVRHHLYADDKQAYVDVPPQDIATARSVLTNCIHDINSWCSSRRLQLNGEKTELIWFGSRHTLQNVNQEDLTWHCNLVPPS